MQLGWTLDKRYRETKKPTTTLEEPGAKTGCQEQKQGTEHTLCPQHLSHPSSRTSVHIPTLTPHKEQACPLPRGANKQGNLLFILAPPCYRRGPSKAMPGKKKRSSKKDLKSCSSLDLPLGGGPAGVWLNLTKRKDRAWWISYHDINTGTQTVLVVQNRYSGFHRHLHLHTYFYIFLEL